MEATPADDACDAARGRDQLNEELAVTVTSQLEASGLCGDAGAIVCEDYWVRHWVCTFPWGVRAVLGYDQELCRAAVSAFAKELSRSLKHRAKRELGLHSVEDALTALVVVVQRTDGALGLNVHLHALGLDGVYVEDEHGKRGFHALGTPSSDEVALAGPKSRQSRASDGRPASSRARSGGS